MKYQQLASGKYYLVNSAGEKACKTYVKSRTGLRLSLRASLSSAWCPAWQRTTAHQVIAAGDPSSRRGELKLCRNLLR
jgi:hypothetical protein